MSSPLVGEDATLPVALAGVIVLVATVVLARRAGCVPPWARARAKPKFLNKQRQRVALAERRDLSHDTRLFRFALDRADQVLGLPTGKHVKIWCANPRTRAGEPGTWNGRPDPEADKDEIERKYTPTSSDLDEGHFDLVVKVYAGGKLERFPDGGKASQFLDALRVGDEIDVSGPFGLIEYAGAGVFRRNQKDFAVKHVGMLAGGTGITPMLQVVEAVLRDPRDRTKLSLVFANQTEGDILLRDRLEELASRHPERFRVWFTLDRPPASGWAYDKGFIDAEMIRARLAPPGPDVVVLMCGPPPMIESQKRNLEGLGYDKARVWEF